MKSEFATPPHPTRVATARTALAAFVVVATGCRAPLDERVSSIDHRAYVAEAVEFVRANFNGEPQVVEPLLVEASQRGERVQGLADAQATVRWLIESLDDPQWAGGATSHPLCVKSSRYEPMRKITHPGERIV